jgi:hypothetical protein
MAGGGGGGQQRQQWPELTFHIFLIKTELWIVGVLGGGQRRNAISKKYPTRKAYIRRKLVLIHWAKNCSNPQIWLCRKNYRKAI